MVEAIALIFVIAVLLAAVSALSRKIDEVERLRKKVVELEKAREGLREILDHDTEAGARRIGQLVAAARTIARLRDGLRHVRDILAEFGEYEFLRVQIDRVLKEVEK
jgi:hypothetical protein